MCVPPQILGPSVLAGVAVIVLLIPLNGAVSMKMRTYQVGAPKGTCIRWEHQSGGGTEGQCSSSVLRTSPLPVLHVDGHNPLYKPYIPIAVVSDSLISQQKPQGPE